MVTSYLFAIQFSNEKNVGCHFALAINKSLIDTLILFVRLRHSVL